MRDYNRHRERELDTHKESWTLILTLPDEYFMYCGPGGMLRHAEDVFAVMSTDLRVAREKRCDTGLEVARLIGKDSYEFGDISREIARTVPIHRNASCASCILT